MKEIVEIAKILEFDLNSRRLNSKKNVKNYQKLLHFKYGICYNTESVKNKRGKFSRGIHKDCY